MMGIFRHSKNNPTLVDIFTFVLRMCKVKPKGEGIIGTRVHEARACSLYVMLFPMCFTWCEKTMQPSKSEALCSAMKLHRKLQKNI